VALPFELLMRHVDVVEREDRPDHRLSRPRQQVLERQVITAAGERLAGGPAGECLRDERLLHQGSDQRGGELSGPRPPEGDQLRAGERARALDGGQAHVLDRIGVGTEDHVVEESLDGAGQEVAHGHIELPEPVILAPFLIAGVVVPQRGHLAAEDADGPGPVPLIGRGEPVAVQLQVGELVGETGADRAGDRQRGELPVPGVCPGRLLGHRQPPGGVGIRLHGCQFFHRALGE
jgi:hypothetical protein